MTTIPATFAALLSAVQRPGDFVTTGTAALMTPLIEVDGVPLPCRCCPSRPSN